MYFFEFLPKMTILAKANYNILKLLPLDLYLSLHFKVQVGKSPSTPHQFSKEALLKVSYEKLAFWMYHKLQKGSCTHTKPSKS